MKAEPIKILMVDDTPENLVALEALFRRDGMQPLAVRSGAALAGASSSTAPTASGLAGEAAAFGAGSGRMARPRTNPNAISAGKAKSNSGERAGIIRQSNPSRIST